MTTDVEFLQKQISVFAPIEGRWLLILDLQQKLPFELMKIKHSKNKTLSMREKQRKEEVLTK